MVERRLPGPGVRWDAESVKALRARTGLSQPDFAKALRVSSAAVEKWEQGLRSPRGLYARHLSDLAREVEVLEQQRIPD